jgi:hypothetical protein
MFLKLALSVGLLATVAVGPAFAQTTSDTRSPVAGDPGAKPVPVKPHKPFIRKHAVVTDKPAPGATTGNAPDRAAAAAGGR